MELDGMNKERADQYQSAYMADYGFESVMVHYRRELLLERLDKLRPGVVVEIGCGSELLYDTWLQRGGSAECWIIVEPSEQFYEIAANSNLPNLHAIRGYFERSVLKVKEYLPKQPDMVICSSLLHEVPSAPDLLAAIQKILGNFSLLHLNVPNSESLHRRLAKAMGFIADTKSISDRNSRLLQHRVYDMQSLKADLEASGLSVIEEGGCFVKPFTHSQMEKIAPVLGEHILRGLYLLGKEMPELASEIFVEARRL